MLVGLMQRATGVEVETYIQSQMNAQGLVLETAVDISSELGSK